MTLSRLAVAIAATIAASGALAQTPAKKPVRATPAAKAPAPEPAASKPAPPPPSPPPFAPVRWQADAPISAYVPNDVPKVYEWVNAQIAAVPGKPDQFSTTDERRNYEVSLAEKLKVIGPLAVISPCTKKYNADRQEYEVRVVGMSIQDETLRDPNPESLRLRKVTIGRGEYVKDTYTGQNAFGASTEISRTVGEIFALTFTSGLNHDPSGALVEVRSSVPVPYKMNVGAYTFAVGMPPSEAREQDKNISCLTVFTVTAPGAYKFIERSRPTRDMPFESTITYRALMATFDMLAVVNTASGQVYAKATRQGFPGQ